MEQGTEFRGQSESFLLCRPTEVTGCHASQPTHSGLPTTPRAGPPLPHESHSSMNSHAPAPSFASHLLVDFSHTQKATHTCPHLIIPEEEEEQADEIPQTRARTQVSLHALSSRALSVTPTPVLPSLPPLRYLFMEGQGWVDKLAVKQAGPFGVG